MGIFRDNLHHCVRDFARLLTGSNGCLEVYNQWRYQLLGECELRRTLVEVTVWDLLRIIRSPFPTDRVSLCETTVTCGTCLIINLLLISRKLHVYMVSRPYPITKESVTTAKVALLLCRFKNLSVGSTGNRAQSYRLRVPYPAMNWACQSAVKDLFESYSKQSCQIKMVCQNLEQSDWSYTPVKNIVWPITGRIRNLLLVKILYRFPAFWCAAIC